MMKLNLGCGYRKREGWTNVDADLVCQPDIVHELLEFPWPFDENSADEVAMIHVLEHIAPDPKDYLAFWKELYRVCAHHALIHIEVPYWKHENFFHDPTHIRPITPIGIAMFDQIRNRNENGAESKLGMRIGVDFELIAVRYETDATSGEVFTAHYQVRAVKPARITGNA